MTIFTLTTSAAGSDRHLSMGNVPPSTHSVSTIRSEAQKSDEELASRVKSNFDDLSTLSESDKFVLQQRFQQLKPDNNGFIVKTVFETEEYSDPFCKQVWMRIPGDNSDPSKVDINDFMNTIAWWQHADMDAKLKLLFSWMVDSGGISAEILAKVLGHVLPKYTQDELKLMSTQIVDMMSTRLPESDAIKVINEEEFLSWFASIPQDKLKKSLAFNIQCIN